MTDINPPIDPEMMRIARTVKTLIDPLAAQLAELRENMTNLEADVQAALEHHGQYIMGVEGQVQEALRLHAQLSTSLHIYQTMFTVEEDVEADVPAEDEPAPRRRAN